MATKPFSRARSIQAWSRSRLRTVSYRVRSNFSLRAAARRAAASACGVSGLSGSLPFARPERSAGAAGRSNGSCGAAPVPLTARGPAALAILARGGRGYRRGTSRQPRLGRDLGGIDAGKLGDAPRQPVELHRLEEGDEPLVVGLMHGEIADRHVEHHVIVEGDELLRQARVLRVLDQRLPALLLLDLGNAR